MIFTALGEINNSVEVCSYSNPSKVVLKLLKTGIEKRFLYLEKPLFYLSTFFDPTTKGFFKHYFSSQFAKLTDHVRDIYIRDVLDYF